MASKLCFMGFLIFNSSLLIANEDTYYEEKILLELQLELQELINWECSPDNPSLGKFINLKCDLLSTSD